MSGLFGGGGGAPSGSGTSGQPLSGTAQIYQPQNQPGLDQSYQTLLSQLYNPTLSTLQQYGNTPPSAAAYNRIQPITTAASTPTGTPGAYGVYGDTSVNNALTALEQYQGLYPQLMSAGATAQGAGLSAIPQVQNAAFSPQYGETVQNITANPYFNQAVTGAQSQADIGAGAAGVVPGQNQQLAALANQFPTLGASAADTTTALVPGLQNLSAGAGSLAPSLSTAATNLNPQLENLYNTAVPSLISGASNLSNQAQSLTPFLENTIAGPGGTMQASSRLAGAQGALAPQFASDLMSAYQPLQNAATRILNTGFDPQQQLYDRTATNTMDQANALNAMSGVANTPYGAGVADKAMSNFNIDWQNQQLNRQAQAAASAGNLIGMLPSFQSQALSGLAGAEQAQQQPASQALSLADAQRQGTGLAGTLLGNLTTQAGNLATGLTSGQLANLTGAGNLYSGLSNTAGNLATTAGNLTTAGLADRISSAQSAQNIYGGNLAQGAAASALAGSSAAAPYQTYQTQQQNILNALGQRTAAAGTGAGALGSLTNQIGAAGNQQTSALANLNQFGQAPYNAATTTQQNAINAMLQQAGLGNQQYQQAQQLMNDLQSYLNLGQSASGLSGNLGNLGTNQLQSGLAGVGSLAGLSSPLLFGSGGLSGALGLNPQTGLLGGLGGLLGGAGAGYGAAGAGLVSAAPLLSSGGDLGALGATLAFL